MRIRHPLIHLFITVLMLFGAILPASAQSTGEQPCDASAYINQLLTDIGTADTAIHSADRANIIPSISAYNQISDIRRHYEDNILGVPSCALVLHNLITQWFAAAGDKIALIMAIAADPANTTLYEERITHTDVRLNDLATAANNEFGRIQGVVVTEPEPEAAEPAPPAVADDWYRVYFTDPVNSDNDADHHNAFLEQSLIFMIDNARFTIDAALFELDAPDTTAALVRALGRGVQVRMVVDDEHNLDDPGSTIEEVIAAGAQVRPDNRTGLMHHKFFIFDGLNVWTGATNITRNGIYNNNNNAILIQSLELAANYQAEFDEMFSDGAFGRGDDTRQTPNRFITVGNTLIETYFAPEDGRDIEARLVELVNSAQRSVRVMAFSFTLNSVGDAMLNRMNQGVLVEGVFETTGSTRGQMPKLFCAGANVVQDGNPSIMHHKVFIIDEQIVVMGSFNFSSSARDTNSENLLAIHNPNIAALYLAEFQRVLSEGRVPDRSAMRCAA